MNRQDLLAQPPADYMNEAQQGFFRELLLTQRYELQARIEAEFLVLREQETNSDPAPDSGHSQGLPPLRAGAVHHRPQLVVRQRR